MPASLHRMNLMLKNKKYSKAKNSHLKKCSGLPEHFYYYGPVFVPVHPS